MKLINHLTIDLSEERDKIETLINSAKNEDSVMIETLLYALDSITKGYDDEQYQQLREVINEILSDLRRFNKMIFNIKDHDDLNKNKPQYEPDETVKIISEIDESNYDTFNDTDETT